VGVLSDASMQTYKREPIEKEEKRKLNVELMPEVDMAMVVEREIQEFSSGIDVFFVSDEFKYKKLYCVPSERYSDIIWVPYTEGISTTLLRKERGI
jgi:hypothetical protein